jgi:hypothetical protein
MKLSEIKLNPKNPRTVKKERFDKIKENIKSFPKMLKYRPIVINNENIILGGNLRYKALKDLGYKEIPNEWVVNASDLTDKEKRQFIILDNMEFGDYDYDMLANEWDLEELNEWGFNFPDMDIENYQENWKDMPEFIQDDQTPFQSVIVHFKDKNDVERFAKLINQKITDKTKYLWFPIIEIDHKIDVRYTSES